MTPESRKSLSHNNDPAGARTQDLRIKRSGSDATPCDPVRTYAESCDAPCNAIAPDNSRDTTQSLSPRCHCGYLLINGVCPICSGKQIRGADPKAHIPKHLRGFVIPQHFESLRHYYAWRAGVGLETEKGRREIPRKIREMVMQKHHYRCQWFQGCETGEAPTVEHIRPVAFGGSNHPGNLTLLCPHHQRASWARWEQLCLDVKGAA